MDCNEHDQMDIVHGCSSIISLKLKLCTSTTHAMRIMSLTALARALLDSSCLLTNAMPQLSYNFRTTFVLLLPTFKAWTATPVYS